MGSFKTPDCSGPVMVGDVKDLQDDKNCYHFTPSSDPAAKWVGINFGSGYGDEFYAVRYYGDDHCGHSNGAKDYYHQPNNYGMLCLPREWLTKYKSFHPKADPYWDKQKDTSKA